MAKRSVAKVSAVVVPDLVERANDETIRLALQILETRAKYGTDTLLTSPGAVRDFLKLRLGTLEHEVFDVMFLTSQSRLIACERLFTGTLTQTSVYPREVIKAALRHNAAAVIFAHNHPSGHPEPSRADEMLTETLKKALALIDIRVLDHMIVAGTQVTSFAERGLL